jgi:hypothetical protein
MKRRAPAAVIVVVALLAEARVALPSEVIEARPGATVRVTTGPVAEGAVVGQLVEFDRDTITLAAGSARTRIRIPRASITRMEVKKGGARGRHAAIGALIGLGVGLGLAAIEHSQCKGEWLCGTEFAAYPLVAVPAGALIGVAIPGNRRWVDAASPPLAAQPSAGLRIGWTIRF